MTIVGNPAPMAIDWDVPVEMDDGVVLRADIYRPNDQESYPAILSYGPYAKWLHIQDSSPYQWNSLVDEYPEVAQNTSGRYIAWEVIDPEKWVGDGYVVVRFDSRGAGRSQGLLSVQSPREYQDLYDCIEWAADQPWCNGKIGLNGISYYATNQWMVASMQPPHLEAICIWEGNSDPYRDRTYHGGIHSGFADRWYGGRILPRQHGVGARGFRSRMTAGWVAGPETLTDEQLEAFRSDHPREILEHPWFDEFWASRLPDFSKIEVPLLSAANWGGAGNHLRGNVEGFIRSSSEQKWLEFHGGSHWTHFYTDYGVALQKEFFNHFLKGQDNGWDKRPPIILNERHPEEKYVERAEEAWPLSNTQWTQFYLHNTDLSLSTTAPSGERARTYEGLGDGLTYITPPLEQEQEITGPISAKLFISSATEDADLFLVLRVFRPDFREVTFHGANEPHSPVGHGWLRVSHRKLDEELSTPYRPYHTHDEPQPMAPGEIYEVDVEIWPTSIVIPKDYRLGLSIRGRDYIWPGAKGTTLPASGIQATAGVEFTGVGPFRHNIGKDRPPEIFADEVTIHQSATERPYVLLPIIPRE